MNLSAASKITGNEEFRGKVTAAIRNAAATRYDRDGLSGRLARVALLDPTIPLEHMLVRLAANTSITDPACPACGNAWKTADGTIDAAILYVVDTEWDKVAAIIYPDTPQV